MKKHLLLVDFENVHKVDLSVLDDSYRAIIFVGANQNPPKAAKKKATAHRFKLVEFQKIAGSGKNALDFHIAFHLGRTFETAPDTVCIVLSGDKGYDPLLLYLNNSGLRCRRVESLEELLPAPAPTTKKSAAPIDRELVVCRKCQKASTIEHHGGRWCTNCGSFVTEPDPDLLPSRKPEYLERSRRALSDVHTRDSEPHRSLFCVSCHQPMDVSDGIYDDGEWTCFNCAERSAH